MDAPTALRLWHLASLDAPTVAVVWSLALARVAGVHLPAWVPLLLVLGTWMVYVGDRLLDARRAQSVGHACELRERHRFHWQHRRLFVPGACVAAVLCAALVLAEMPAAFRARNTMMVVAALAYLGGVHLPRRPAWFPALASKEALVGVLFATGCAFPTLLRADAAGRCGVLIAGGYLAAVAWLNCYAIDRWEASSATCIALGAGALAMGGVVVALALGVVYPAAATLVAAAAASSVLLALLDGARARMTSLLLRVAADLALLTPVVLLR